MFIHLIRNLAALILGFVIIVGTGVVSQNLFRREMLSAAGWQPGMTPSANYIWATLASDVVGTALAGFVLTLVAGRWGKRTAGALIIFVAAMRLYQYVSALESNPHWYALALVFIPVAFIPVGLVIARKLWSERPESR